ncbi:MAG: hypothetical protein OXH03_07305 [Bacteroidetes bacterium]|nr:hypothetical protein [Bacteroidota bacterium]MDE2673138.1 hypothetical protein [Bacteroidota bacterium]
MTWKDFSFLFGFNGHRARLLQGLLAALQNLASAGCRSALLNGSFVSNKELPGDYDGAWRTMGVDEHRLDPVLLDFSHSRSAMKSKYLGELFPSGAIAAPGVVYEDFFKTDRNNIPKGIVYIDLATLP